MIRSILSVVAGIAALTAAAFAIEAVADPVLMRMFPQALPNEAAITQNQFSSLFLYAYTALCIAFGGYVTARIARRSQVLHAVIMGAIQTGLTALAMISFRDKGPLQIWIVSMAMTIPAAWCGGILRARKAI
jgi:putative membrane protein (TIGR04086 family)